MKLTVVITSYNYEKFIRDCIKSALVLDWPDKEIIVVDDASEDDSVKIIDEYPVTLIKNAKTYGPAGACNVGLDHATGDAAIILCSDDVILPLAAQLTLPHLLFADFVISNFYEYWDECSFENSLTKKRVRESGKFYMHTTDQDMSYPGVLLECNVPAATTPFRTTMWKALGGMDEQFPTLADWDLWIRAVEAGMRFIMIPEPIYVHRYHPNSLTCKDAANNQRSNGAPVEVERMKIKHADLLKKYNITRGVLGQGESYLPKSWWNSPSVPGPSCLKLIPRDELPKGGKF